MRIRHQEREQASRQIDQGDPLVEGMPAPCRMCRSHGHEGSGATHAALLSWGTGDGKALRCARLALPAGAEQAEATGGEEALRRSMGHLRSPTAPGCKV